MKCKETFLLGKTPSKYDIDAAVVVVAQGEELSSYSKYNGTFPSLKRQLQGSKSCNIGGNPETTKTAESDECVDVWTYSPYVAAEVSASGTRLATN